jgi:hypothetical protein
MKRFTAMLMAIILCHAPTIVFAQQQGAIERTRDYWFAYATKLPIGAVVRVRTTDGTRHTGILVRVDEEGIIVEPKTRVPEPPLRVVFQELQQLELKQNGSSLAKAVAIGAAVGAGTFFGVLLLLVATAWD